METVWRSSIYLLLMWNVHREELCTNGILSIAVLVMIIRDTLLSHFTMLSCRPHKGEARTNLSTLLSISFVFLLEWPRAFNYNSQSTHNIWYWCLVLSTRGHSFRYRSKPLPCEMLTESEERIVKAPKATVANLNSFSSVLGNFNNKGKLT